MKKLIMTLSISFLFAGTAFAVGPTDAASIKCSEIAAAAAAKAQAAAQGNNGDPAVVAPAN